MYTNFVKTQIVSNVCMHKVVQSCLCRSNTHSVCAGLTSCSYIYCPIKHKIPQSPNKVEQVNFLFFSFISSSPNWLLSFLVDGLDSPLTNLKIICNKASQTRWPCQQIRCCTSTYCVHTLHTKKISSNLNSLNTFTKVTGSSNVKLVLIR